MMNRPFFLAVALSLAIWALSGCDEMMGQTADTPAPAAPAQLTYEMPVLEIVPAGSETQTQGGVVISMTPPTFAAKRHTKNTCTEKPALLVMNDQFDYEVKAVPYVVVEPDRITFKVKVRNRLSKILKLESAIFKFTINGEEKTIDEAYYKKFQQGTLTPNADKEFVVEGPDWRSVPNDAVLSLQIFEIQVAKDAAGNTTQTGNFEWNFKVNRTTKSESATVDISRVRMTRDEASRRCR